MKNTAARRKPDRLDAEIAASIRSLRAIVKTLNDEKKQLEADNKRRAAEAKRREAEEQRRQKRLAAEAKRRQKRLAAEAKREQAERKRREAEWNKVTHELEEEGMIDVMDDMDLPALRRNFARAMRDIGMQMETVKTRVRSRVLRGDECDILGVNVDAAVRCEVKAWMDFEAVYQMDYKLKKFRGRFPRYDRPNLYGAIVGLSVDKRAAAYAHEKGLLVFEGYDMEPLLPPDFTPRKY